MKKIILLTFLFLLLLSTLQFSSAAAAETALSPEPLGFGEAVTAFFSENAGALLGTLTLIVAIVVASLLLSLFSKIGLLPLLRSGLSALGTLLGKSRDLTEHFTKNTDEHFKGLEDSVAPMVDVMRQGEETLSFLEAKLASLEEVLQKSEEERHVTAEELRAETEQFYEMLSSADLPEEEKASMTESYYRLKHTLEAKEE